MDIRSFVDSTVRKHHSRNPFEIAKGLNIMIIPVPLIDCRGFYQYFQRNNIIYIDENLSHHDKMFVCAHELAHMLLHKKANTVFMETKTCFNTNRYEEEANKFAMELLVPDEVIFENWQFTTNQIARLTGYTEELIKLRLK